MKRMARDPRAGYALLFVYAMAATMAIMLYMAMPRVAFEAQRDKEQLLIDRGEQYKRAVQLYVRKFNRFPADMQALESTQNIRFLRKQYVDPMTGKNEWRLIHVGPGGQFLDSLVNGNQQKKDASAPQSFITEMQQIGGNGQGQNQGVNLANRRRPSDDQTGAGGGNPGDPNNPGISPPITGPVMVLPDGRIVPATSTGVPAPVGNSAPGGSPLPGQIGTPRVQPPPGAFQTTPNGPAAPNGDAANLINQILTTPRPGGLNGQGGFTPNDPNNPQGNPGGAANGGFNNGGLNGAPNNTGVSAGTGLGGTTVGGGIAGVASKMEQDGIKLYNDRTAYNEWEFVYDMTKDPSRTGNTQQRMGNGALQQQPGGNTPITPPVKTPGTGN
jgi:hypothetical protein